MSSTSVPNAQDARPVDWRAVYKLLASEAYEQAAALLHELQVAGATTTDRLDRVAIDAIHEICLACLQCQAEGEWHRQAERMAQQRAQILTGYAQALLDKVSEQTMAGPAQPRPGVEQLADVVASVYQPALPVNVRNLVQRVKYLFVPEPGALASPLTQGLERPDLSDVKVDETLPPRLGSEAAQAEVPPAAAAVAPELSAASAPRGEIVAAAPPGAEAEKVELEQEALAQVAPATSEEPALPAPAVLPAPPRQMLGPSMLMIYCFGQFRAYQNDQLIEEWNGLKGQAVLKYLAAYRGTPTAKDVLMDTFWPETEADAARRNLHQAIYSLRQTLRRRIPDMQYIQFENNQYVLTSAPYVWVDVEEFQAYVQSGQRLEAGGQIAAAMLDYGTAESLYQGDFLEEDVYDDWPCARRERLRAMYLDIADRLSEYYCRQGEYSAASTVCQKILTLDSCVEEAHRRLMRCYLAQGQRHPAIRQYHTCVQALAKELDAAPSDETRSLYMSIIKSS